MHSPASSAPPWFHRRPRRQTAGPAMSRGLSVLRFVVMMGLTMSSAAGAATATQAQSALETHTWQDRVLLVFAPNPSSQWLATQRQIVRSAGSAFADRNLIAVEVVGDQVIGASNTAAYLRNFYRVPPEAFKALLIGKDSGVKLVSSEPLSAQQLNATIDAMPMRRAEMKGR